MSMTKEEALKKIEELKQYVEDYQDDKIEIGDIVCVVEDSLYGIVVGKSYEIDSFSVLVPEKEYVGKRHDGIHDASRWKYLFPLQKHNYKCCWFYSKNSLTKVNKG